MNKIKNTARTSLIALVSIAIVAGVTHAGSLTPSNTPPTTSFYTLSDVYDKLVSNTSAGNHDISTTTSPASSFRTIAEIYNAIPDTLSLSPSSSDVPVGINRTTTSLSMVEADLVASNIRSGVIIFGVTGTYTGSGGPTLEWQPVATTTSMCWSHGAYEQGYMYSGGGVPYCEYFHNWITAPGGDVLGAKEYCEYLDVDGSTLATSPQNIWRLPTYIELFSVTDTSGFDVQGHATWSSTPHQTLPDIMLAYNFAVSRVINSDKVTGGQNNVVRCVRSVPN